MTPDQITELFTRETGDYVFARWGRPLAPVIFGVEDSTLAAIKGAMEAVCALSGHQMAETDPELGANVMWFFLRDWQELLDVPSLDQMIPELSPLVLRLQDAQAQQYRLFRFDDAGAIQACFVFLRMDKDMQAIPAEDLALSQAVQLMLLWSEAAFRTSSPLARAGETTVLRPDIAEILKAAYDPVMPASAKDPSHALRLAARLPKPA